MTNPEAAEKPEAEAEASSQPASPAGGGFGFRAVIVGAVTFVVVVSMVVAVWVFVVPRPTDAVPVPAAPAAKAETAEGDAKTVVMPLITDGEFTNVIGPTGERAVTCRYDIAVKVSSGGADKLKALLDPKQQNMMPHIAERIRQIIWDESYAKLCREQLDDVKLRIRNALNAMIGEDAVQDVYFQKWDIFQ